MTDDELAEFDRHARVLRRFPELPTLLGCVVYGLKGCRKRKVRMQAAEQTIAWLDELIAATGVPSREGLTLAEAIAELRADRDRLRTRGGE